MVNPAAERRLLWPLVRSAARLPWAMTLWGVQQAVNLMRPGRTGRQALSAFDAMSRTASEHLGDATESLYRTGEHLQGGLIEATSALVSRGVAEGSALSQAWAALAQPLTRGGGRHDTDTGS